MDRWQVAIGAAVLVAAGCSATAPIAATSPAPSRPPTVRPTASTAVIPWSSATPAPSPTPAATAAVPSAPACRTDQLAVDDVGWGGAGGSLHGGFLAWNTSDVACRLDQRPTVAVLDGTGHALDVRELPTPDATGHPFVLQPRQAAPETGVEAPPGIASDTLDWSNWCGPEPKEPMAIRVLLADGGVIRIPALTGSAATPRCDAPDAPSVISAAAFEETPGPPPTEPPTIPAEALSLVLVAPDHVVAGRTLEYQATLTNSTSQPIVLAPCPSYQERLNSKGGGIVAVYVLACETVPILEPGASATFAMELDVPPATPPDAGSALVWVLDPYHTQGFEPREPGAKVALPIVTP